MYHIKTSFYRGNSSALLFRPFGVTVGSALVTAIAICYESLAQILFQCIVLNYYLLLFLFKGGDGKIK